MAKDDNYTNVLLEEMHDQIRVIHEITVANQPQINKIAGMEQDIKELKADVKTIKHAVKDTNTDLRLLERRVTNLENAA